MLPSLSNAETIKDYKTNTRKSNIFNLDKMYSPNFCTQNLFYGISGAQHGMETWDTPRCLTTIPFTFTSLYSPEKRYQSCKMCQETKSKKMSHTVPELREKLFLSVQRNPKCFLDPWGVMWGYLLKSKSKLQIFWIFSHKWKITRKHTFFIRKS